MLAGGSGYVVEMTVVEETATHVVMETVLDGERRELRRPHDAVVLRHPIDRAAPLRSGALVLCEDNIGSYRVAKVELRNDAIWCEFAHGGNRDGDPSALVPITRKNALAIIKGAQWASKVDADFWSAGSPPNSSAPPLR